MQIHAPGPEHGSAVGRQDGGRGFEEEERSFGPRAGELGDVVSSGLSAGVVSEHCHGERG